MSEQQNELQRAFWWQCGWLRAFMVAVDFGILPVRIARRSMAADLRLIAVTQYVIAHKRTMSRKAAKAGKEGV